MSRITARTHLTEPSEKSGRCTRDRLLEIGEQFAGCGMVDRQQAFLGQEVETRRGINATECLFGQTGRDNRFPVGGNPCVGDDPQSWIRTGHPTEPNLLEKLDQRVGLRNNGDGSMEQVFDVVHANSWNKPQAPGDRRNSRRHPHRKAPTLRWPLRRTRKIVFPVSWPGISDTRLVSTLGVRARSDDCIPGRHIRR